MGCGDDAAQHAEALAARLPRRLHGGGAWACRQSGWVGLERERINVVDAKALLAFAQQ